MRPFPAIPLLLALVLGAITTWPGGPGQPVQPPASQAAPNEEQLDFARRPITYFNQECGACHGNYGSFWGEGFAAAYDDAGLRKVVDEMAAGPAQMPLEGLALDVQVAYHRSLVDGKPFVTVFTDKGALAGEVTPGSEVVLVVDGKEQRAAVEKHVWRSQAQAATAVRVKKGKQVTEVKLEGDQPSPPSVSFSHGQVAKPQGQTSMSEPSVVRKHGGRLHTISGLDRIGPLRDVVVTPGINHGWAEANGNRITRDDIERLLATARPLAPDDPMVDEWHYAPWCAASFRNEQGRWSVTFFLGGLAFIADEQGKKAVFLFEPPAKVNRSE